MNKNQSKHFKTLISVQEFMDSNTNVWNPVARIVRYKNNLDEIVARSTEHSEAIKTGTPVTERKKKVKKAIALKASVLAGALHAHASEMGDLDLAKKTKLTKSDIEKITDTDIDSEIKAITDVAKKILADIADLGVTEDMITEILTSVDEFNRLIGKPKSILNTKFENISSLDQLLDTGFDLLNNQMDKVMLMFRDSNPSYYEGYQRARSIDD